MRRVGVFLLVLSVALGAAACSDDEGGTVTSEGSGSGTGTGSVSGTGTGSASASGVGACEPVGDGDGTKVEVTLDEWSVTPKPTSATAGKVTFDNHNEGEEPHELVVVRAASADDLTVVDGKVDEEALPAGAFIGEVEAFPAGEECEGTFELAAGTYVLFCNIVEEEAGKKESHFEQGMVTSFEVR